MSGNSLRPVSGLLALGDPSLTGSAGLVERLVHDAGPDGGDDATGGLDSLQFAPRLGRQLVGEVLDVPRPPGRVDDAGEVALQLQDGLGVAGDPPAERRAPFGDEDIMGLDGDGVGAAHAGGEAGHGGAQGVHPRVVAGHHHA